MIVQIEEQLYSSLGEILPLGLADQGQALSLANLGQDCVQSDINHWENSWFDLTRLCGHLSVRSGKV